MGTDRKTIRFIRVRKVNRPSFPRKRESRAGSIIFGKGFRLYELVAKEERKSWGKVGGV
jgi:hypothetical protein